MINPFKSKDRENFPNTKELVSFLSEVKINEREEENEDAEEDEMNVSASIQEMTIDTLSLLNPVAFKPNQAKSVNSSPVADKSFFDCSRTFMGTPPGLVRAFHFFNLQNTKK